MKIGAELGRKFPVVWDVVVLKDLVARGLELRIAGTLDELAPEHVDGISPIKISWVVGITRLRPL